MGQTSTQIAAMLKHTPIVSDVAVSDMLATTMSRIARRSTAASERQRGTAMLQAENARLREEFTDARVLRDRLMTLPEARPQTRRGWWARIMGGRDVAPHREHGSGANFPSATSGAGQIGARSAPITPKTEPCVLSPQCAQLFFMPLMSLWWLANRTQTAMDGRKSDEAENKHLGIVSGTNYVRYGAGTWAPLG